MAEISESEKLGMASLIASINDPERVNRAKKADRLPMAVAKKPVKRKKITREDVESGKVSIGDANDEAVLGYKNGGMIDRKAIRGKTRGKIC